MAHILMIIGHEGFRDEEYFEPKEVLESAGHTITTCAKENPAVSKIEQKEVQVDILFDEVTHEGYDAVAFIGGPGAQTYLKDKKAHQLAWDFYNHGKLVTAICIAPVILANAGLLTGKKATVWSGAKAELCAGQCLYNEHGVIRDGRIITASGPDVATEFGKTIVEKLG